MPLRRAAIEAAGQLALDCAPNWTTDHQPSDRIPTPTDVRRAELADLTDQRAPRKALRHARTVPTGSYL
ncbi:hypothetical protein [Streptomyces bobili]|uniref:hypothetical protein n=1 Tax=Streptomyces bobili TaxID=67280 RepID=UPI000A38AD2A|nr:hypothetical protein [Streptomyces bobili]